MLRRSLAPLALMALIFALSAQSDLNSGLGALDLIGRKIVHASSYALLTWLWFRALRGTVPRPMLSAVVISVLYAISDEYHQHFVHGRHGTPIDVLIDSVGIGFVAIREERKKAG
jgi:VanZ family protein